MFMKLEDGAKMRLVYASIRWFDECTIFQAISDSDVHNIVISYLVHNCYKETAESFISCTETKQSADYIEDMEKRKSEIWRSIICRRARFVFVFFSGRSDSVSFSLFRDY